MAFKRGHCFYSKTLGANVIYESDSRPDPFYAPALGQFYSESQLGEFEPLVRDIHYQAAMRAGYRLKKAYDMTFDALHIEKIVSEELAAGWEAAVEFMGSKLLEFWEEAKGA